MRNHKLLFATVVMAVLIAPASLFAGVETTVSAAIGGVFPAGTTFSGVPLNGLQAGFGLELENGQALGELNVVLLGVSLGGISREITIVGKAQTGGQAAPNIASFSGTCSVDMGDGGRAVTVPFTATVSVNPDGTGTLGLVIGDQSLPTATIDAGSMSVTIPPIPTL